MEPKLQSLKRKWGFGVDSDEICFSYFDQKE